MSNQSFDEVMEKFLLELREESELTEKQQRILEASIKLFSEKGFHAASTSEIAREAGVAEGTIFRHFRTKKDILIALLAPLMIKFFSPLILKDVKKIFHEETSAEEILRNLYRNRLEFAEKNLDRLRIFLQEAHFQPEIREALVEYVLREGRRFAEIFITSRIQSGEFKDYPPTTIFRSFMSMMGGYFLFKFALFPDEGAGLDDDREIDMMVDIILNGVKLNGVKK